MRILTEAGMRTAIEAMMLQNFPLYCAQLGPRGCTEAVREAVARGRSLNFQEAQLPAWVSLEFAFGPDFATNPAYPWAQEILAERSVPSEPRMEQLRSSAIFYLARLAENEKVPAEVEA